MSREDHYVLILLSRDGSEAFKLVAAAIEAHCPGIAIRKEPIPLGQPIRYADESGNPAKPQWKHLLRMPGQPRL